MVLHHAIIGADYMPVCISDKVHHQVRGIALLRGISQRCPTLPARACQPGQRHSPALSAAPVY